MNKEITRCKDCGCMTHNVCGKCAGEKLKALKEAHEEHIAKIMFKRCELEQQLIDVRRRLKNCAEQNERLLESSKSQEGQIEELRNRFNT